MELTPDLVELAHTHGVSTEFWDWRGQQTIASGETVVAVLAAMGVRADSPAAVTAALLAAEEAPWRRILPPCIVVRQGDGAELHVHVPHGARLSVRVRLEDGTVGETLEHVDRWVAPREIDGDLVGEATVRLRDDIPLGWHTVLAFVGDDNEPVSAPLVVTPRFLGLPERMDGRRSWGFMTQLYSVRSTRSWAHGDLADLGELARWSATQLGAGFVLVNPLHAPSLTVPVEPSPYLPATRRFASPLYIRVEDVPEFAYLSGAARAEVERLSLEQRARNGADALVDRDEVWQAKRSALSLVHAVVRSPGRQADYEAYLRREGSGLRDFATWCALAEVYGGRWPDWPAELQSPASAAVEQAATDLAERVDFFCWLQWVVDGQLSDVQRRACAAGMPLGVLHDLAVGVHRFGADTWAMQSVIGRGVSVGAPPDPFNQQGQNWSQPPWLPHRLAEAGFAPYRDMLRTVLRHAGGIRVDHVIGLFRLWWVPDGRPAAEGTYVRLDHEALVGILALEASRAGAVVVGEDLGTVEPWARDYLAERGLLGTSILWFERDDAGRPRPPEQWRRLCLASVTTHDLPPTAGYLEGEHIRIREQLGLLTRPAEEERCADAADRQSWVDLLVQRGWLSEEQRSETTAVAVALHRALAATPSALLGVALTDAAGDRRAMNQPGTDDEYPNWRFPLADGSGRPVLLDELFASQLPQTLAGAVGRREAP